MMATCPCVKHHRPILVITDNHHILPECWGGKSVPENMIELCPSTHHTIHACIDEYVRAKYAQAKGTPSHETLRKYPVFARQLAAQAVAGVGGDVPHVYTLNHPWHQGVV